MFWEMSMNIVRVAYVALTASAVLAAPAFAQSAGFVSQPAASFVPLEQTSLVSSALEATVNAISTNSTNGTNGTTNGTE
jgi:hypothetical protein